MHAWCLCTFYTSIFEQQRLSGQSRTQESTQIAAVVNHTGIPYTYTHAFPASYLRCVNHYVFNIEYSLGHSIRLQ